MPRFRRTKKTNSFSAPVRWMSARMKWEQAGRPERSDEEVERIYKDICRPCDNYAPLTSKWGRCKLCNCSLNLGSTLNKIRWATESCPDKPPRWKAKIEIQEPRKKTGTATRKHAVPVRKELQREILQQMTPEERPAEHERRKLQRREARRLAATSDSKDTPGA